MDQTISRDKDFEFDLESGGNTSEEDVCRDLDSSERESKSSFSQAWNRLLNFDGSKQHEPGVETCSCSSKSGDVVDDNVKLMVDTYLEDVQERLCHVKSNKAKEKKKKTNSKPPRPPKGPSLDAADQKLVKEISELALRKRERIKKIKAVRKMKARKASSSSSSSYTGFSALVITIFFLTVIILQGIKSGSSAVVGLMASPEPAVTADEGLISVHFPKSFSNEDDAPGSQYSTVNSFSSNLSSKKF